MAAVVTIGTLGVIFGADVSALARGARTAEQHLNNVGRAANNVSNRMKNVFLAVAGPAALGYLIKTSIDAVSAQKDLAERLGVSVAGVQVMGRAAELAGMSTEAFNKAADRLNRSIGTALADKTSQQADAFKKLGLSAEQLKNMDLDQRFAALSTKMEELNLSAPQMANFLKEIGIRGGEMANLFISGAAGIAAARKELETFGLVNTEQQAAKIEAAGDALTTFKLAAQGVGNALATELSPFIVTAAKEFTGLADEVGGVRGVVRQAVDSVIDFGGNFLDIGAQIKIEIKEWGVWFTKTVETISSGSSEIMRVLGLVYPPIRAANAAFKAMNDKAVEASKTSATSIIWSQNQLRDKLKEPLPSENLKERVRLSREAADQEAAEWAAAQKKRREAHAKGMDGISSKEAEGMQKKLLALKTALAGEGEALRLHNQKIDQEAKELLEKRIITQQQYNELKTKMDADYNKKLRESLWSNITSSYATESEQLAKQYEEKLVKLGEYNAEQLALIGGFEAAKAALQQKYALDTAKMQAAAWSSAASVVDTAMGQISSILADESEKGFTIMKGIAMATALAKGYEAVVSAYAAGAAIPGGGPATGAAFAAIAAAGVAAHIAKLAGVGPNSKGTPSSGGGGGKGGGRGGGGGGGNGGGGAAAPSKSMVVSGFNQSEWLKGDAVRGIVKEIVKFQNDGGKVVVE